MQLLALADASYWKRNGGLWGAVGGKRCTVRSPEQDDDGRASVAKGERATDSFRITLKSDERREYGR